MTISRGSVAALPLFAARQSDADSDDSVAALARTLNWHQEPGNESDGINEIYDGHVFKLSHHRPVELAQITAAWQHRAAPTPTTPPTTTIGEVS